jgi:hypothetical protein
MASVGRTPKGDRAKPIPNAISSPKDGADIPGQIGDAESAPKSTGDVAHPIPNTISSPKKV